MLNAGPAYAIPSPELVVSSLSSLSQLWGLAGAMAGGGALVMGARGQAGRNDPRLRRWFLVAVAVAAGALILDAVQFVAARAERTARLEAALVRPAMKRPDGQTLDPLLREMPYSAQLQSPNGLSTADVAGLLPQIEAGDGGIVALDIRESAETEQGGLPGTRTVRFPDLAAAQIDFTGKTALLFCHNGNRSAETCAALNARGVPCRFMVGGYEKWLVEGRTLSGSTARTLADLRGLPAFPNQTTLLETADVKRLMARERAHFVDVRYPGEFDSGHLPGAINLPIRPTPSAELERQLSDLPGQPVIAPCYDRRSCFYAEVLGLELTRRGRAFAGRYTVPWEYFEPPVPPPHVQKWLSEANLTWQARAGRALADGLEAVSAHLGVAGAIVALAALARALVWPFAAKADADQKIARVMAPEVAALKARLADDPQRLARALRFLMARHGLTPLRNLLALGLLPVLALSVDAVTQLAQRNPVPLAWLADLNGPDPLFVLPALFGLGLGAYLHLSLAHTRPSQALVWLVAAPGLAALAASMPAAVELYLVVSATLLLIQRGLTAFRWAAVLGLKRRAAIGWSRFRLGHDGLVALKDVGALDQAGNKALRLAQLAVIGLPAPGGVVLTSRFLHIYAKADDRWRRRRLGRLWRYLGVRRVAVRSSSGAEDGALQSFAGVFESVLDVDRQGLEGAIERVVASFRAHRAGAYAQDAGSANILIQPMIAARFAGVCFTQDPAVPGCALVEWVAGNGEALVSGAVTPNSARIGRLTGEVEAAVKPPCDLKALWAAARRIEARFGRPQDIEWAFDGRRLTILQSRDIVPGQVNAQTHIASEWQRLAALASGPIVSPSKQTRRNADAAILALDPMSELLPYPTPASLSLLNAFWRSGGSMDLAARSLGLDAPKFDGDRSSARPLYVTAFGALYVDERERAARTLTLSRGALRRLAAQAQALEADIRTRVLPQIAARAALHEAIDLARLPAPALLAHFDEVLIRLINDTHVAVDRVNIAAQVFLEDAHTALSRAGKHPASLLAGTPHTMQRLALRRLPLVPDHERLGAVDALLGHRSDLDYELAAPRYGESITTLLTAAQVMAASSAGPRRNGELRDLSPAVRHQVLRAQKFVTLKEDAKHESLREIALLRRLMVELDRRFQMGGTIFFLDLADVAALDTASRAQLADVACDRRERSESFKTKPPLPSQLSARVIERGPMGDVRTSGGGGTALQGTRVSGHAAVEGRAICAPSLRGPGAYEGGAPIPGFEPGDIIVARALHPGWLPHLIACGGVAVETGGWLSHMAIVARERGVAMSVGVRGLDAIKTGMRLRLEADGRVVRL